MTLTADDRARVPFALIGVLLLVSSATLAGALHSRPDPRPDVDTTLAVDRTTAASQTALRDATKRGADRAARRPLLEPSNTSIGRALGGENASRTAVFENYLSLLVYLEARQSLAQAGQSVRDADTTASLPPIEDAASLETALNRTSLRRPAAGLLEVALENVTVTVERDGEVVATRTETVTTTVATTVFQLHERVTEYERQLERDAMEGAGLADGGFGRQFSARIYPLGWARGFAQYGGLPVTEVIANRHVEVLANDAVFATQRSVFGTTDPHRTNTMRAAWGCLAARDAQALYSGAYDDPERFDAADVCAGLEYVYGDVDGDLPEAPTAGDLVGDAPGMDADHTIAVNQTADLAFRGLFDGSNDRSLESVIERIHTVDVETESDVEGGTYEAPGPAEPPVDDPGNWTIEETAWTNGSEVVDLTVDDSGDFPTFTGSVESTFERTDTWTNPRRNASPETVASTTATYSFEVALSGRHSPEARVDRAFGRAGVEHDYVTGGEVPIDLPGYDPPGDTFPTIDNYANVPGEAVETLLDGRDGLASELERAAEGTTSASALEDDLDIGERATVRADPLPGLEAWLVSDLLALRNELRDESVTVERQELVTGNPAADLVDRIEDRTDEYVSPPDGSYDDVPDKVRYEARLAYVNLLLDDLETVANAHDDVKGGLEDEIDGIDGGIEQLTSLAQDNLAEEPPRQEGELPGSPLLGNVSFEIAGSPTYLTLETVDRERVPAVQPESEYAPMAARNTNRFAIPYSDASSSILDLLFDSDEETVVTLKTAGEVYVTSVVAEAASDDLDFQDQRDEIGSALLAKIHVRVAGDVAGAVADEFESVNRSEVRDVVVDEFDAYGSVGEQAIAATDGRAMEDIPEALAEELPVPDDVAYGEEAWRGKLESVTSVHLHDETKEIVVDDAREPVDEINNRLRETLENKTDEVLEKRLNETAKALEEKWMGGETTPNRIPAGMPITPVPGYWFATANVWDVDVRGSYARFEVTANTGTPATASTTTYVRENGTVSLDVTGDGTAETLGSTEPVSFASGTTVLVVVPPGGQGVGDRTGEMVECSPDWPVVGELNRSDGELNRSEIGDCS